MEHSGIRYPKVGIIILNWNGLVDTVECLNSLKKITYPNYEVIVVDNGSEGNDVAVLNKKFSDYIHLIKNNKNYGFAEGNNIGISYAMDRGAQYVLLLNNDTTVEKDFLKCLVGSCMNIPSIGLAGPRIMEYFDKDRIQSMGLKYNFWLVLGHRIRTIKNSPFFVDALSGCALLINRSVISDVGHLDKDYFSYSEETDYCWRAKVAGYKIMVQPNAVIFHKGERSLGKNSEKVVYFLTRNRVLLVLKNGNFFQRTLFLLFSLWVGLFIRICISMLRGDLRHFSCCIYGTIDGLRGSFKYAPNISDYLTEIK